MKTIIIESIGGANPDIAEVLNLIYGREVL